MKFTIERENLLKALGTVQGAAAETDGTSALCGVKIAAKEGRLTLTTTNLESFAKTVIAGSVVEEGAVLLSAKKLCEIVKQLPDKCVVELASNDAKSVIKSGSSKFSLNNLDAGAFPETLHIKEDELLPIGAADLREIIEKTVYATSVDITRPVLAGVFVTGDGECMTAVATNSHRLTIIQKQSVVTFPLGGVIIPREGLSKLMRVMGDNEGMVMLGIQEGQLVAKHGNAVMGIRLIDGQYPEYKEVLPAGNDKDLIADRLELISLISMASLVAEGNRALKMSLARGELVVSAENPDLGNVAASMAVDYKGENFVIGFNEKYLLDFLERVEEEKVRMTFKTGVTPCEITPLEESENYRYIVMPMALSSL